MISSPFLVLLASLDQQPASPRIVGGTEAADLALRDAVTPFGGNGAIRPWRHYLYRNLVPTPLPQSRYPRTLRQPTPMRWGYPGPLSQVTKGARAFSAEILAPAPGCLPHSVSSRALLGTSLIVHE